MELTLQSNERLHKMIPESSRNPYFIGINSAINGLTLPLKDNLCRNPYFIGINSAIYSVLTKLENLKSRNPYFIGINSAINNEIDTFREDYRSQSLFYWN